MEYSGKHCQVVLEALRQRPVGRLPHIPQGVSREGPDYFLLKTRIAI
jgi:hypothetical protein